MDKLTIITTKEEELQDVTDKIQGILDKQVDASGICHLFVPHTTAAVTINENGDPDVVGDLIMGLNALVPRLSNYRHLEGNSPAHIKSSLFGCSLTVPVVKGRLCLGRWQGIYFCEFDGPRQRKLYVQLLKER